MSSDAAQLYHKCLGVSEEALSSISETAPFVEMVLEFYVTHRSSSKESPLHSKFFIALVNHFMKGYLRFSV